jgi:uncharacterized protein (TIGR04255 family)
MGDIFAPICYRKNFLKEVIARVDLLSPLPAVDDALPASLAEVAVRTFPIPEPREALHRAVQIGPEGVSSSEKRLKEWRFHGRDRTKTLTISREAVLVQHTTYQTYELVRDEFSGILERVAQLFPEAQPSRVGLRYVNSIELPEGNPTDWSSYLAPPLLSLFGFPPEADRPALARVFHNLELSLDAFSIRYRLGMHNPDYPARIRQKVFVLDLDAYLQAYVEIQQVTRLLDKFHQTIQQYFELSITDGLRSIMSGR